VRKKRKEWRERGRVERVDEYRKKKKINLN
jgi:hypothetical protein